MVKYESVIHEFDPYFNYRSTIYLIEKGFYEFWNWFDHESWYPLGRIIGFTVSVRGGRLERPLVAFLSLSQSTRH